MFSRLINLSKFEKKSILIFIDSVLLISILLTSFSLRLGYWYFPESTLVLSIFFSPLIGIPIFYLFGLYKLVIRFITFKLFWKVFLASSFYSIIWGLIAYFTADNGIPRSVILINWILSLFIIITSRIIARWFLNNGLISFTKKQINLKKNILIYGAGVSGFQLASSLEFSSKFNLLGFVDDSREKQGRLMKDLNIYPSDKLAKIIERLKIDEILIAIPSISRSKRLNLLNKLALFPVLVRILPGMNELAENKINISDLRQVDIKDLLGRDSIEPHKDLLKKNIINQVVLVTGAGGSIGSELCRQIIQLQPKCVILYEINEFALYTIEKELSSINANSVKIYPILGSINNKDRFSKVVSRFNVTTVYHAAAYKHVPMVELNITEGVMNNIFGTLNCANVSIEKSVKTFVLVSTDKAVRPSNTMGATKRISELILQALSLKQSKTKFIMVRFGNVLGSSGSVIPLFKSQIEQGGPITVTDKNIIRYFMTVDEAVELVIQSGAMGQGGDVFVLNMGDPVPIIDLAKKMVLLSGLEVRDDQNPEGDIEIKYTGLRPGEKLYEELLIDDNAELTENPLIMRAEEKMIPWEDLEPDLKALKIAVNNSNYDEIRSLLIKMVSNFKPQIGVVDILNQQK